MNKPQPSDITLNATSFKARNLKLLDQLQQGELARITVTKRGKAVAVVTPAEKTVPCLEDLWRDMRGSVTVAPGVDLTAPTLEEDWEEDMLRDWDERIK